MKTGKFFILLLCLIMLLGNSWGQTSVPNTTTFTLQNVVDVVNPTTDDLGDSFSDAISGHFNITYKNPYFSGAGNRNNLLMFRDYGIHNCTKSITLSTTSGTTSISVSVNVAAYSAVIVHIGLQANETVTPPSGWSELYGVTGQSATYQTAYRKVYTTATTETVDFTFSGSSNKIAAIYYAQNTATASANGASTSGSGNITYTTDATTTEFACRTYISSLLIPVANTPTITNGTDWTTIGSGILNTWGYGAQKHSHPSLTGNNIPTTSYSWTTSSGRAHGMFTFY